MTGDDYADIVSTLERLITEYGKFRVLVRVDHLTGVELQAIWDDLKMRRHIRDFGRFAAVTDRQMPSTHSRRQSGSKAKSDEDWDS